MRFGLDYASSGLGPTGHHSVGSTFACRYVSTPGNPKNANKGELDALRSGGIDVVIVFETTAARALAGHGAGAFDAGSANAQCKSLGMPAGRPIYFAVDFDATPGQQAAINDYFRGVASVIGLARTGIYAGYWPSKRAKDAGVVAYIWQTYAWSGGSLDSRAQLYQYSNGHTVAGVGVDYNHAIHDDFGQWGFKAPPKPKPKPHDRGKGVAVAEVHLNLATLAWDVIPKPGKGVEWEAGAARKARVELALELGGKTAGRWHHKGLPFGK